MKLYTYSKARQRFAEVLEEASRGGQVRIRRQDGRLYAVTPVATSEQSPFANVTGRSVPRLKSRDLIRALREEGERRGTRAVRAGRKRPAARAKRRVS